MVLRSEDATIQYKKPFIYGTPWMMFTILSIYLLYVLKIGPKCMKRRKPYALKKIIICYNIGQIIACIYIVQKIFETTEGRILQFWNCEVVAFTPELLDRYFNLSYFTFWLKISELIETVLFVLRKKQNQITKLHIFHHCSTVTLIYMLINHNVNGFAAFYAVFLNSAVHIIMYTYYLIAAVTHAKTLKRLMPVKKSITVVQMMQFVLILSQTVIIKKNCGSSTIIITYYAIVVATIFYGFYDFYKNTYYSKLKEDKKPLAVRKKAAAVS